MRADEYVVQELLANKEKNAQLIASNAVLRQENKELETKYNFIKSLFTLEETFDGNGYRVCVKGFGYCGDEVIARTWTKKVEEMDEDFINLINALGLEFPIEEPKTEELEKDPELVAEALEKAKELQAKKETETTVEKDNGQRKTNS